MSALAAKGDQRADPPRSLPVVHVALATYNGRRWIEAQVRSILRQEGVDVRLVISDDGSTDGTLEWLGDLAAQDPRVTLLPRREGPSGVGANFLYALTHTKVAPGEFFALSDQDDLWRPDKLAHQINVMRETGADAVSSNVYAFRQDRYGAVHKWVIRKDHPQTDWDFVFEAPSAGSTFLLDFRAWNLVKTYLGNHGGAAVWLHDWFIYALVRAAGMNWMIETEPLVAYRQHEDNELGAHRGLGAIASRFKNLRSGRYLDQFIATHDAAMAVGIQEGRDAQWLHRMSTLGALLTDGSWRSRLGLLRQAKRIRRKPSEGVALALARVLRVW